MIQNDVLEIVMTLSKSERRLFKLSLKIYQNKEINLLESLFDIYCKNDHLVKINLKAKAKIQSKRIDRMHSELYKKLQDFIASIEIKKERKYRLYNNIFTARGMLKRKLYNQAFNLMTKTIEEATFFEIHSVLIEAYSVLQFLQKFKGSIKNAKVIYTSFLEEYLDVIEKNYKYYKSFNLYAQLQDEYAQNGPTRDESKVSDYNKIINNIEIGIENGFNINKVNLLCLSMLGHLKQDSKILIESKENLYTNYLNYPRFIEYNPSEFFLTCYNYAGNLISNNQLENVEEVLEKLDLLVMNSDSLKNKEIFVKGLYLSYNLKNNKPDIALKYAREFKVFIETTDDLIYLNFIAVNIVTSYLMNGEYEAALEPINTVLNRNIKTLRKDCYSLLLTYEIIIFIKLEWIDLVAPKIKSLNRYLKTHYNKTAFEKWLIKFLNRTQRVNFKQACIEAYQSIDSLNSDSLSKDIFDLSEFETWFKYELNIN